MNFDNKCAKTPKLKKIRRAFEKELSKSKFVKKCAKTPKEPKIYLSFAKILKKLLEEIATKERKENRKIFLFTFNSYKSLEQEVGEWGQHTIGILDFIILLIGDENNPGDFYCELKDKYSEEAFKTLRINIKSLRFLCSPDGKNFQKLFTVILPLEHYSEDFKKEISKIGRKNVQFSSRIHAKLPETEPEKNKEKKPKLPYNVYRPLLTAIKRILKKEGTLENLKKNNSSDLFIMSKGKEDLFNKFKKMSTEALEKVKDCLHKLWKKPAKNLIEYNDALPKAIEESIKCIEIELRRPKEVPNNDNEMLPEEVPINDNEMVPEEVPINDNEMVPEEVPINDNEMVPEEVPINDNEMVLEEVPINDNEMVNFSLFFKLKKF